MQAAGATDTTELPRLLLRHAESLGRYVQGKIPKRYQEVLCAEDVLQETWIAACEHMPADVRDVDRWLIRVASTKLVDALRAARALKRGGGLTARVGAARSASYDGLVTRLSARGPTPSRDISAREARSAMQVALARLGDERRQAIQLHYIEGLGHNEIARVMGKSKAAVNSLLFRALRELHVHMGRACRFFSDARSSSAVGERPRAR